MPSSPVSGRDVLFADFILGWILVALFSYAYGTPLTFGGLLLEKVLFPIIQILTNFAPNAQAQGVLFQDYLYAQVAVCLIEVFELFGIPILLWVTRP